MNTLQSVLRIIILLLIFLIIQFISVFRLQAQTLVTHNEYLNFSKSQDTLSAFLYPYFNTAGESNAVSNAIDFQKTRKTFAGRKLHNEHLIQATSEDYTLFIDPVFHFSAGRETGFSPYLYENTRGFRIGGSLSNTLYFSSELYETQSILPGYLEAFTDSFGIVPGLMRAKEFKEYGRDYAYAYGTIAWRPFQSLQLMFSRDKLHFGHGYRSMLLSDNAPGATFFRTDFSKNRWSYHFILASYQNPSLGNIIDVPVSEMGGYQNKYANFIILTFKPTINSEISLFESMIWAPHHASFNALHWKHFNPVPLSKTLWYGLENENNAMTGIQMSVQLFRKIQCYGQFVVDEITTKRKTSIQAGVTIQHTHKNNHFSGLIEYNTSGAYTYSHTNPLQSYSHYHHSLAHPLGANFREILFQASFNRNRWTAFSLISFVNGGTDTPFETSGQSMYANPSLTQWKGSIYPELTSTNSSVLLADLKIHYMINPSNKLNFFAAYSFRKTKNTLYPRNSSVFQAGISMNVRFYDKHNTWL